MSVSPLLQAAGAAVAALIAWLWWGRRKAARRAEAQERRAELAEAQRDGEHATAVAATRTAELTADQRTADGDGEAAAKEIRNAPHDPDPIAELRAVDRAARELHTARREGADGGHGGAPAVPPRRR